MVKKQSKIKIRINYLILISALLLSSSLLSSHYKLLPGFWTGSLLGLSLGMSLLSIMESRKKLKSRR